MHLISIFPAISLEVAGIFVPFSLGESTLHLGKTKEISIFFWFFARFALPLQTIW
jgi:hypothetical protein